MLSASPHPTDQHHKKLSHKTRRKEHQKLGETNPAITTYKDDSIFAFDANDRPTQKTSKLQH
jgi:hypothetical protein